MKRASAIVASDPFSGGAHEGISLWNATEDMPTFDRVTGKPSVDVCVVGAGIAGLSTAFLLSREGRSVAVVERQAQIGGHETRCTTAHLSNALDAGYRNLERLHGKRRTALAAESHTRAIDLIESIVREEGIECDFERLDGYLALAPGDNHRKLEDECKAAKDAGVPGVEQVPEVTFGRFRLGAALRFPKQAQFHPLKYLAGLARILTKRGVRIYGSSEVTEVHPGEVSGVVTADGAEVEAAHVVVATNTPFIDWVTMHTKQAAYRSYAIGLRLREAADFSPILLWDTADPFHYVRIHRSPNGNESVPLVIVGGEDHKTGQAASTSERYERLERWARQLFPGLFEKVVFRWSGQIIQSVDGLGYIGKNPQANSPNIYIATGDSGNGITHGTIAGMVLTDLIQGRRNRWAEVYDPSRKPLRMAAARGFASENLNVAAQYADWLTPGKRPAEEIPPGAGVVVRRGLEKVAVYRGEDGSIFERSAVCPHLGCIVAWNSAERTWDCPCHGSRFSPQGAVLNGPAISHLSEVKSSDDTPASHRVVSQKSPERR